MVVYINHFGKSSEIRHSNGMATVAEMTLPAPQGWWRFSHSVAKEVENHLEIGSPG